jgi:hypothetical protein
VETLETAILAQPTGRQRRELAHLSRKTLIYI